MSLKERLSDFDWSWILLLLMSIVLFALLIVLCIYGEKSSSNKNICANRKVVNVTNIKKDHYRHYRVGKVNHVQHYEIEYVRIVLDDHTAWEAKVDDLDHDVMIGNTMFVGCNDVWDKTN